MLCRHARQRITAAAPPASDLRSTPRATSSWMSRSAVSGEH